MEGGALEAQGLRAWKSDCTQLEATCCDVRCKASQGPGVKVVVPLPTAIARPFLAAAVWNRAVPHWPAPTVAPLHQHQQSNAQPARAISQLTSPSSTQVGGKMSSLRHVQTGKPYQLPPPAPGIDPDACQGQREWQRTVTLAAQQQAAGGHGRGTLLDGCVRAFRGVSPSLVRELCSLAGVDPETPVDALPGEHWATLHDQWQLWLGRMASQDFAASSCPRSGAFSVLGSYAQHEDGVLNMLGRHYSRMQAHGQFEQVGAAGY
jgi:hypothetical protein